MITIYHNPRCEKSRECVAFIEKSTQEFEVIKYLEIPFSKNLLLNIIKKLNIKPIELVRTKEKIWIKNYKGKIVTDDEIINAMIENPILIERPIAVNGEKAVIARPFERIKEIL